MKKYTSQVLFLIVILLLFSILDANACALCKETVGSSGFSNRGLNKGILYLMVIPYIAFILIAYFWYRSSKKQKQQEKKLVEVLRNKSL